MIRTNTNLVMGVAWLEENILRDIHVIQHCVCFIRIRNQSMDRKMDTLNWKEWNIRMIWWPANSVDRYSSATVATDVYGGFRCLEERSVDGRWMENHARCRSVHRMCRSWLLFVMIVDIWTCTDRRMWCWSSRSLCRQKWKCCTMQFSCRMETSSSLIRRTTTRMCSSSVNSRSMGGSSSGVSILDRLHRLDWMIGCLVIYRSMKMENIFIADHNNGRVVVLHSRWTDVQILSNRDQHLIESPRRLCYIQEKQQLIVGQRRSGGSTDDVRVFNLCSHTPSTDHRTFKSELDLIKSGSFDHVELKICDSSDPSPRMPGMVLLINT